MTTNQVAYWALRETQRSNLARETETNRSNLINEAETHRANVARETETNRANLAQEGLAAERNQISRDELNETRRANLARESETSRSNLARETEQHRTNRVHETLENRRNKEQVRSNKAKEKETHRANKASENQTRIRDSQNYTVGRAQAAAAQSQAAAAHRQAAASEYNAATNRYNAETARAKAESEILRNESEASKTFYGAARLATKYGPEVVREAGTILNGIKGETAAAAKDIYQYNGKVGKRVQSNINTIIASFEALPGKAATALKQWQSTLPSGLRDFGTVVKYVFNNPDSDWMDYTYEQLVNKAKGVSNAKEKQKFQSKQGKITKPNGTFRKK